MKNVIREAGRAALATVILGIVCCGVYPLVVYGLGELLFPVQAHGSLVRDGNGTVRGSELLGQRFVGLRYFHSRPSAAGQGFDASSSGGSNLGPTSKKLHDQIQERIWIYRKVNGLGVDEVVPADAVTASASGLDPHISVRNAEIQSIRVARIRNLSLEKVKALVGASVDGRSLGFLGEPGVNVLRLNLALDQLPSLE